MNRHAVLLGDSIFDNAWYVPDGPAVIDQLRERLGREWQATLLARDGATAVSMRDQLGQVPDDATHLVVSVGGNDALGCSNIVQSEISADDAFAEVAAAQREFQQDYRRTLQEIRSRQLPTLVCTVYDAVPDLSLPLVAGLSYFNDVILREAIRVGLPVLDLRLVCDSPRDYSEVSPIEPSEAGGSKIARAIRRVLASHDFNRTETVVYGP
ncbi:MAG TPA: SGNH/GDSL hydrolase family protein [Planctomycetaceae bacterium]|nr:SGNH/GDSL hydrolase family protein [Planctomycetaceae bacterium]